MILAMRAIWACWNDGAPLDFRGEFYRHTLMTPFFNPGPTGHGPPKVFLAAVGEHMTEVAGEVADGILIHGFTTERYVREVTIPAVERGLAKAGRSREGFEVSGPLFVVTGTTDEEIERAKTGTRQQIAFYGIDAELPARPRPARVGRAATRAQRAVEAGQVGRDGRAHRRRDALDVRGRRRPRRRRQGACRPLQRPRQPLLVLRAVPQRSAQWRSVIADLKSR